MTMIDKFLTFTKHLPSDQMDSVDSALAALMESFSADYDFTASELAELDRRVANPRPKYADPAKIEAIFGKPFTA